jgi:hypothetical protein
LPTITTIHAEANGNLKTQWKILKEISGRISLHDIYLEIDGNITSVQSKTAGVFNDYFVSSYDSNNNSNDSDIDDFVAECCDYSHSFESLFLEPVHPPEINKLLRTFPANRAPGYDNVNSELLKSVINELAPILSHIFNLSFTSGVFPDDLKKAVVVPLKKRRVGQVY